MRFFKFLNFIKQAPTLFDDPSQLNALSSQIGPLKCKNYYEHDGRPHPACTLREAINEMVTQFVFVFVFINLIFIIYLNYKKNKTFIIYRYVIAIRLYRRKNLA